MATTFDVNRIGGGTFELVQNPSTGQYELKSVGFQSIKKLNLPDLSTAATTTTTTTTDTAKAATEATAQTIAQQTTSAFKTGGEGAVTSTGQMLSQEQLTKQAGKIDPQLGTTRPTMRDIAGEALPSTQEMVDKPYQDAIMRGSLGVKAAERTVPGMVVDKTGIRTFGAFDVTPKSQLPTEYKYARPSGIDTQMVTAKAAKPFERPTIADISGETLPMTPEVISKQPKTIQTTLKKVSTSLKSLADSVGKILSSGPLISLAKAAFTETPQNKFDKAYFNADENGRISGNPTTDLYAGFNRVSAFGDLQKAGEKRIATREATIAKKGYGPGDKFYDDTQNMKNQQADYKQERQAEANKRDLARGGVAPGASGGNAGGGAGSARVICTELHSTKELSTEDWVRDIKFTYKNLTKKHIKGYLAWAIPTVKHIRSYPKYRNLWKHIAQHRANDIAWRMKQGKFDLLGRIYAGIGEPLCWLIGNFVNDKLYNELNENSKRHI